MFCSRFLMSRSVQLVGLVFPSYKCRLWSVLHVVSNGAYQ